MSANRILTTLGLVGILATSLVSASANEAIKHHNTYRHVVHRHTVVRHYRHYTVYRHHVTRITHRTHTVVVHKHHM